MVALPQGTEELPSNAVAEITQPEKNPGRLNASARRLQSALPEQLRQPCDVDGDAARLVLRENLRLSCFVFVVARVDVNERLAVGVADDVAAGYLVGVPGRRETSGHGLMAAAAQAAVSEAADW
jgi:hypothetical protein